MRRRSSPRTSIWLCSAASLVAWSCSQADPQTSEDAADVVVVDAAGREVALRRPAERIVSLVPSATSTLRAIGAESHLVGRTDFDTQSWATGITSVGGGIEPSLEAIVDLRPDLVIRFAGEQDVRTPSRLDELGITHVAIRPDRIDDIYETALILGTLTGLRAEADSLVEVIRGGLRRMEDAVAALPRRRVAYVLGGTPPWVAGPETYIHEIVSLAGGDNVFDDLGALYSAVSREELLTRGIEVVLVAGGDGYDPSWTPDARVEQIGGALEIPGPGVVEAARLAVRLIHGIDPP